MAVRQCIRRAGRTAYRTDTPGVRIDRLPMLDNNDAAADLRRVDVARAFWGGLFIGLLAAGVLLQFSRWNLDLLLWARANAWLPPWFWMGVTVLGTGWVAVLLVSMVDRRCGRCSLAALSALLLCGVLVTTIKHWLPSPRPLRVLGSESLLVMGQQLSGMNSMPSGHALSAMAAATVILLFLRACGREFSALSLFVLPLGFLVAWSRIVVGAHWPADIFVGSALGIAAGHMCWRFSLWCQQRMKTHVPKLAIVFELLVLCYAPFEKNGYPDVQLLLWVIMALAGISVLCRLYRLYGVAGSRVPTG